MLLLPPSPFAGCTYSPALAVQEDGCSRCRPGRGRCHAPRCSRNSRLKRQVLSRSRRIHDCNQGSLDCRCTNIWNCCRSPAMHLCSESNSLCRKPPQLLMSELRSLHVPPHFVWPAGQPPCAASTVNVPSSFVRRSTIRTWSRPAEQSCRCSPPRSRLSESSL